MNEKRDTSKKGDLKRQHFAETDKLAKAKLKAQIALLSLFTTKKGIAFIVVIIVILIMAITNPELLAPLIQSLSGLIE